MADAKARILRRLRCLLTGGHLYSDLTVLPGPRCIGCGKPKGGSDG